jgi:four helix bundle protein
MFTYSFEKLEVWQNSRSLVKFIYQITKNFPDEEKYGITNQIRRAAISVSSNLAEGSSRKTFKEQARFTQISFASLLELLNQLILSNDLKYITDDELLKFRETIEIIGNKLNALHKSQINK